MPLLAAACVPPSLQVETQLRHVNAHFARLNGMSGAHGLDLYGRTAALLTAPAAPPPALQRKPSKRLPLREETRALLRQAHGKTAPSQQQQQQQQGSLPGSPGGTSSQQLLTQLASRTPSITLAPGGVPAGMSRQSTVRFDIPMHEASQGAGGGGAGPQALTGLGMRHSHSYGGGAPAGVLQIPDERQERLEPYRCAVAGRLLTACMHAR